MAIQWKQISEFNKETYRGELLTCVVWLGLNQPIVLTCKYNPLTDKFDTVRLSRLPDGAISLAVKSSDESYNSLDIRCWTYTTDLVVETKEFRLDTNNNYDPNEV